MSGKNFLLVDDNALNLMVLEKQLEMYYPGSTIHTTDSPQDALDTLRSTKIDIVITDYYMPVLNGVDFIKELQLQHPELQKAIIATGDMSLELDNSLKSDLKVEIVVKPLRPEFLKSL